VNGTGVSWNRILCWAKDLLQYYQKNFMAIRAWTITRTIWSDRQGQAIFILKIIVFHNKVAAAHTRIFMDYAPTILMNFGTARGNGRKQ
jgi:hypothetical protein